MTTVASSPDEADFATAIDETSSSDRSSQAPTENRALVPLAQSSDGARPRPKGRMSAGFLAQLIAVARQLPQMRARRRGEPSEASATYAAMGRPRPREKGRILSRVS